MKRFCYNNKNNRPPTSFNFQKEKEMQTNPNQGNGKSTFEELQIAKE